MIKCTPASSDLVRIFSALVVGVVGVLSIIASGGGTRFNDPLIADAGRDRYVKTGQVVWLNGAGSNFWDEQSFPDPNSYRWGYVSGPTISTVPLLGTNAVFDSIIPDVAGEYVFELQITTEENIDSFDQVTITATNPAEDSPPNAHAGPYQIAKVGDVVYVDGRQSNDPDGDILSSTVWTMSVPPTGTAELSDSNAISTYFIPDVAGTYRLIFLVGSQKDGATEPQSDRDETFVIVTGPDIVPVPVANAGYGLDQYVKVGSSVVLDGSRSYDAQGNELEFIWRILARPSRSSAQLVDLTSVTPSFVADQDGAYVIQLEVRNSEHSSLEYRDRDEVEYRDRVVIVADTGNSRPMARVGFDQTILLGEEAIVDGSASFDADGDELTYMWEQVSVAGSPFTPPMLTYSLNGDRARFTPEQAGTYTMRLVVSDGFITSFPITTLVHVRDGNQAPIANAGVDRNVTQGNDVTLDGSASSDPDGHPITYQWTIVSKPQNSVAVLSDPAVVSPGFNADQPGDYIFKLVVNDGIADSAEDTVTITATPPQVGGNTPPVADAGPDDSATLGVPYTLDGTNSSDADGNPLTFIWAVIGEPAGSNIVPEGETTATPSFTPEVLGNYEFRLIVNDGTIDSVADMVVISVNNNPPVANAGPDQKYTIGQDFVFLNGTGSSDPDVGDTLTYSWTFVTPAGASAPELIDPTSAEPSFIPAAHNIYRLQLIVNDGKADSVPDYVEITR